MQTYSPSGLVTVFLSVLSNAILTRCKSQTYIADDEMADLNPSKNSLITYLPSNDSWAQGNKLPNFGGLDISKAWASTWHNASTSGSSSTMPSLNFTFNGTAVDIRCILQRAFQTSLTMTLDGEAAGTFQIGASILDSSNDTFYNQVVYNVTGLDYTQHTLIVALDDLQNTGNSYNQLLFDRAEYTIDDSITPTPPSSSSATHTSESSSRTTPNVAVDTSTGSSTGGSSDTQDSSSGSGLSTGRVVGITIGAGAFAALCLGVLLLAMRHRRIQNKRRSTTTYSNVLGNDGGSTASSARLNVLQAGVPGRPERPMDQFIHPAIPRPYILQNYPPDTDVVDTERIPTYGEATRYLTVFGDTTSNATLLPLPPPRPRKE